MNDYLVTAENIDGEIIVRHIKADSILDAKELFYNNDSIQYLRIVSVAHIKRDFRLQED